MIKFAKSRPVGFAAAMLLAAVLAGCPSAPVLQVAPAAVDFGSGNQTSIRIQNAGGGTLNWSITEVTRANDEAPWVPGEVAWLSAEQVSGSVGTGLQTVRLNADTSLLPVGTTNNVGIRVDSNAGSRVVPVSINIAPTLLVNPPVVNLAPQATQTTFTITNTGTGSATWNVRYLPNPANPDSATALPATITVNPNPGSTAPNNPTEVSVAWQPGQQDFALLVASPAGNSVVRFRFGTTLNILQVNPETVKLYFSNSPDVAEQPASRLTITNSSGTPVNWTLEAVAVANPSVAAPITVDPNTGSTPALGTSQVNVRISSSVPANSVLTGSGNYQLVLRSGDSFIVVPVIVELRTLPEITLSEPPEEGSRPDIIPINLLDLGTDDVQAEFWIVNTGPKGSQLNFQITHEDQSAQRPVLASVEPQRGYANQNGDDFFLPGTNDLVGAVRVTVTVDRSAMTQDVEFRTITIAATESLEPGSTVIAPVEVKTLRVRIERPPLVIEGAINRSRPPFLMRFVFLLRDNLGKVIRTSDPEVMARVRFDVEENDQPLDLNETNQFVEGPEGLKTNMVLLLDFTGSMYNAGTNEPENPLARGEALARVREAAEAFIRDLPPGYNLQLMYYNDRQQVNRILHPFSSDRDSLVAALRGFTISASEFGVSTIRDALMDAIGSLASEDAAATLPFDEADVRAVVFITDGVDNASLAAETDVVTAADEARVRLYPLVYSAGSNQNVADMIVLAAESGGHLYRARSVLDLTQLLNNQSSVELSTGGGTNDNQAAFTVRNVSNISLSVRTQVEEGDWVVQVNPALQQVQPGNNLNVVLQFDTAGLEPGEVAMARLAVDTIPVTTTGEITITATPTLVGGQLVIEPENVSFSFRDTLGTIWDELSNQIVLTYITPSQTDLSYSVTANYQVNDTQILRGRFEEDAIAYPGDVIAGQISLVSSGIQQNPGAPVPADRTRAEIFVRADYVPRGVTSFRMRFFASPPADAPAGAAAALAQAITQVELAPDGLLVAQDEFDASWRLLSEGDGIYRVRTEPGDALTYGAYGNLLKITISNLGPYVATFSGSRQPEFLFGMRVDNDDYYLPAGGGQPSRTKYFLYPGGPAFFMVGADYPGSHLVVGLERSDIAGPAPSIGLLQSPSIGTPEAPVPIRPEALFPWDLDGDGIGDFQDPAPLNPAIPSAIVVPDSFEIGPAVNTFNLLVRNNRLDTFEWSVASQPDWISSVTSSTNFAPLAPGETSTLTLTVNRAGLPDNPGIRGTLVLDNDVFGPQEVDLTLVNIAAP
jgi:hypothetical protein